MAEPRARERRVGRRVSGGFRLVLDPTQFGTLLQVRDLSMSGVSFCLTKPVEYMTRVQLVLWLPNAATPGESGEFDCAGVVVRCDPTENGQEGGLPAYDVAVFFTDMPDETDAALEQYVDAQPAVEDPADAP